MIFKQGREGPKKFREEDPAAGEGGGGPFGPVEPFGPAGPFGKTPVGPAEKDESAEERFEKLCQTIFDHILDSLHRNDEPGGLAESSRLLKDSITGEGGAVAEMKNRISEYLAENRREGDWHPPWYEGLTDAVFRENWGAAGLAPWWGKGFYSEAFKSSSAKIIGNHIFFLAKNGKLERQPQTISDDRREQLITAFLTLTPEEHKAKDYHEIYLRDGERVTIYKKPQGEYGLAKKESETIILRRQIIETFSLEEQARRGTISGEMAPLLVNMVKLGYNTIIAGAVRTAKTTFLATLLSYEDPELEGTLIETDPEIPMHKILPGAAIIQLVADKDKLSGIVKNLMRSDSDYLIMAEARDGVALDVATRIASRGTRRVKMTYHCKNIEHMCRDMAYEVTRDVGGDIENNERKIALSFDYIIHTRQLADKTKKRLNAIYDLDYDEKKGEVELVKICSYDAKRDAWVFKPHISKRKQKEGREENEEAFVAFRKTLAELADKFPMNHE